ncbi:MOB kinase activator 2-like [Littorina saxatilis]|uniref:MOB kinase activator 2-like n=1 Tax=Littorina saxatilis TaxID=31220 RepID=UPI0038B521D8
MGSFANVSSLLTMKFYGFSETFKAVLFKQKGRRKDKDSPTPPICEEQKQYLEESCLRERVIEADFIKLVQLPPSLDSNEWLATHTISFFNHVNLMYGVVSEYCTSESCASMIGPDNVQYHWQDEKGKKLKQSAPQYIDHMMSYIQKSVTDESIFPTKFGQEFPAGFVELCRKIHRYLFHVLAHIYHSHFSMMVTLGLAGHLNTLFSHFMLFSHQFHLLPDKEAEVLNDLHKGLLAASQDPNQNSHTSPHDEDNTTTTTTTTTTTHTSQDGAGGEGAACPSTPPPPQTVSAAETHSRSGSGSGSLQSSPDKKGSRSGSENGSAGMGVRGPKTLVDIPST